MKLHAVTLNPALDLSGHVSEIVPNEKNYVSRPRVDPGGNGINAARMAARLGARVDVLGFLGGAPGAQIRELLELEMPDGMRLAFDRIRDATRTNVTVTNDSDHNQTRLTFPGPNIAATEKLAMLSRIAAVPRGGLLALGGSVPASCGLAFVRKLLEQAARRDLGLIVDVPAAHLKPLLLMKRRRKLLLIKPNRVELESILGKRLARRADIEKAALRLLRSSAMVCVSLGSDGAILAAQGRIWRATPLKIRARGSVGAGDSMVGAMAARLLKLGLVTPALLEGAPDTAIRDVFAWGMAAGAATAEVEGTGLGKARRVAQLARQLRGMQF